jgi:two-component system cell cycle sensor histidine kinase/response regulator CckA
MPQAKPVKQVLVVEDNNNDYTLIARALNDRQECFVLRQVDGIEELEEELLRLAPDVVLCDHASAKWNSQVILEQVRAFEPTMPFVVVSGSLDERTQGELISRGADACVCKDCLAELSPVVEQALHQQEEIRRRRVEVIRQEIFHRPVPDRRLAAAAVPA